MEKKKKKKKISISPYFCPYRPMDNYKILLFISLFPPYPPYPRYLPYLPYLRYLPIFVHIVLWTIIKYCYLFISLFSPYPPYPRYLLYLPSSISSIFDILHIFLIVPWIKISRYFSISSISKIWIEWKESIEWI